MKKIMMTVLSLTTIVALTFTSCKKKSDDANPGPDYSNAEQIAHSTDQSTFSDASNEVLTSINDGLTQSSAARLASSQGPIIVVATPVLVKNADVTLSSNKDTLTINFHGANGENTRTRTGKVKVYLVNTANRWFTKDAQWKVDFGTGVTVTRNSDSKSVTLKGTKTITNVTGGKISDLTGVSDSVSHKVEGTLTVLLDNDLTVRTWTISRMRTIFKDGSYYKVKVSGFGSDGGNYTSNVAEYGTNRFGKAFTTTIDSPLILQYCTDRYKFVSGVVSHHKLDKDFTLTYGVDMNGDIVTTACSAVAFKVNFTTANNTNVTFIRSY